MDERKWAKTVQVLISEHFKATCPSLRIVDGMSLPYANEIVSYKEDEPASRSLTQYETDLLIIEDVKAGEWKPRVVIECKLKSVTTHDAITYSEKAFTHKKVHPYLRYGILLGARRDYPLPGRLIRHGAYFDFMLSWIALEPSETERKHLFSLVMDEVEASKSLEELLYNSRNRSRRKYTVLHRPLRLK